MKRSGNPLRATERGGLVYSTDEGRMCPGCRRPVGDCACRAAKAPAAPGDGVVRIGRESKGRGGKTVTVVRGLAVDDAQLEAAARDLKALCGSGGTVKDGVIEIQGDHRDKVLAALARQGHRVRLAGG